MVELLDRLDFNFEKSDEMEFCVSNDNIKINAIPFPSYESLFYERLKAFKYIGVKYFGYVDVFE